MIVDQLRSVNDILYEYRTIFGIAQMSTRNVTHVREGTWDLYLCELPSHDPIRKALSSHIGWCGVLHAPQS